MKFVKMHGIGNDFIFMHGVAEDGILRIVSRAPTLCVRRKGIGADGIIFVLRPESGSADFRMRYFNADGSEAQMCGNGIRCFTRYVRDMNLTRKSRLVIETAAGNKTTTLAGEMITVDMGPPVLDAVKIPTRKASGMVVNEPVRIGDTEFAVTAVSIGNPHAVIYSDSLSDNVVLGYGPQLECHPFFPEKTNVEFITVLSPAEIRMRVWERGCGETQACGTGACAAVVAGVITNKHDNKVIVHLLGGDLSISWDGDAAHPVFMTGPAVRVYAGEIE
jgi:diaminopimelate epimerase